MTETGFLFFIGAIILLVVIVAVVVVASVTSTISAFTYQDEESDDI